MCIKLWYSKVYTDNVHTINISEYIHIENTLKFQFFLIDRIFRNVRVKFWFYNQAFMHDNGNTFNVQKKSQKVALFLWTVQENPSGIISGLVLYYTVSKSKWTYLNNILNQGNKRINTPWCQQKIKNWHEWKQR